MLENLKNPLEISSGVEESDVEEEPTQSQPENITWSEAVTNLKRLKEFSLQRGTNDFYDILEAANSVFDMLLIRGKTQNKHL